MGVGKKEASFQGAAETQLAIIIRNAVQRAVHNFGISARKSQYSVMVTQGSNRAPPCDNTKVDTET